MSQIRSYISIKHHSEIVYGESNNIKGQSQGHSDFKAFHLENEQS